MFIVSAKISFPPAESDAMRAACADVQAFCESMPGCLGYELAISVARPGVVTVFEAWEDAQAFERHMALSDANPDLALWRTLIRGVEARTFEATEHTA